MKLLMLDTDISSYIIRRRPEPLAQRFERHADELCVSVITAAELRFGVEKTKSARLAELVENFLERLSVLDWTSAVTPHYARVRAALERIGRPIGNGSHDRRARRVGGCDGRHQQRTAFR